MATYLKSGGRKRKFVFRLSREISNQQHERQGAEKRGYKHNACDKCGVHIAMSFA